MQFQKFTFYFYYPHSHFGEIVYIYGDTPELGDSDYTKGIPLTTTPEKFPIWETTIYLPINDIVGYQYFLKKDNNFSPLRLGSGPYIYYSSYYLYHSTKISKDKKAVFDEFGFYHNLTKYGWKVLIEHNQFPPDQIEFLKHVFSSISDTEFIQEMIESKIDIKSYSNSGYSALHIMLLPYTTAFKENIFYFLIEKGIDINSLSGETPIYLLCTLDNPNIDCVQYLIEKGADPTIYRIDYLLENLLIFPSKEPIFKLILNHCSYSTIEKKLPNLKNTLTEKYIRCNFQLTKDMRKLYQREEFTDLIYYDQEQKAHKVHRLIFQARNINLEKIQKIFSKISTEESTELLDWIYTGNVGNRDLIFRLGKKLGVFENEKEFFLKSYKGGIVKDLSKLFLDRKSKDFAIVCGENEVYWTHRLILCARSKLFRGMFLSVQDDSKQVKDYSGKSPIIISSLIKYFYTDYFDQNLIKKHFFELRDCSDYFLLGQNSMFNYYLQDFLRQNQKFISMIKSN
ncbi:btb/poz domain-containing protein [Anaeramoeba ignava]|uniref:Btb/poz domain-containing protein n=1 Tax=Anaeramoeba ignava TaxID=1746090 RepID=A0A9Q0LB91_ANAIG|nr:btb/poz domain-containing protein [Anaeramoeba ignava]